MPEKRKDALEITIGGHRLVGMVDEDAIPEMQYPPGVKPKTKLEPPGEDSLKWRRIGGVENYYGDLCIARNDGVCWWSIGNYDGRNPEPIPEYLYLALELFERQRPTGLPGITKQPQAEQWSFWCCGDSGFAEWPNEASHSNFRVQVQAWGDYAATHDGEFPDGSRVPASQPQPEKAGGGE